MKLRTAYFCKNCNEEVKILEMYTKKFECPCCGYQNEWGVASIYEWKVAVDNLDYGIGI